jgi:hypothetical protein
VWSDSDASATDVESIEEEERAEVEISQVDAFSPALPSDDDELARLHIARGFEAIREGLPDQARWEFEQARDLADDMDIVRAAQAQLDEMSGKTAKVARRQARPIEKRPPQIIPSQLESTDWNPTVRIGLAVGVLNGVLIGCGAVFCLGFFLAPLLGFAAGWLTARRASTVRGEGQSPGAIHAIVAGGITGLGGWLGEVIGHPIWLASLNGSRSDPVAIMLFVACVPGVLYILLAVAASALGWNKGKAE